MQEKTLTGGRSYYLDIARAIAIISISLNHAVNRTYDNSGVLLSLIAAEERGNGIQPFGGAAVSHDLRGTAACTE